MIGQTPCRPGSGPPAHAHACPLVEDEPTRVGYVSTTFRMVGRNDKIVIDRRQTDSAGHQLLRVSGRDGRHQGLGRACD